ncbi:hypothetical protein D3C72_872440 [compost metagenome]
MARRKGDMETSVIGDCWNSYREFRRDLVPGRVTAMKKARRPSAKGLAAGLTAPMT